MTCKQCPLRHIHSSSMDNSRMNSGSYKNLLYNLSKKFSLIFCHPNSIFLHCWVLPEKAGKFCFLIPSFFLFFLFFCQKDPQIIVRSINKGWTKKTERNRYNFLINRFGITSWKAIQKNKSSMEFNLKERCGKNLLTFYTKYSSRGISSPLCYAALTVLQSCLTQPRSLR